MEPEDEEEFYDNIQDDCFMSWVMSINRTINQDNEG